MAYLAQIPRWLNYTQMSWGWGGSDSSHEVPSKTAAVVTVDNSPEATCSTCGVVSDTDRWLHIDLQDPVL